MGLEHSKYKIKSCKPKNKPYKLFDGGGLHILICPNGSKLWRLKYRIGGKEKLLSLGSYPAVTLKQARKEREKAKELIARSPMAQRWIETKTCAPSYSTSIEASFRRDIFPRKSKIPVADIKSTYF